MFRIMFAMPRPLLVVTIFIIFPVSIFFLLWDWFAITSEHWDFDYSQMLAITGPFNIPLEEYLFFLVVPLAIILTYEGVTRLKPHWRDRYPNEDFR